MTTGSSRTTVVRSRLVMGVSGICVLFIALLSLWNLFAEIRWNRENPVPGSFYSVEGKQLHMVCTGAGWPTIVLESAASARYTQWRKVQPGLARITRTCSYDRAGHGWSDPREGSRDAEVVVRELHTLLGIAGIEKPFVYVGESAGGLYVREYTREFPGDIAGAALIESSSPLQIDELPGFRDSWLHEERDAQHSLWRDRLRVWSGWERLLRNCRTQMGDVDCRPTYVDMDENELPYFAISSQEAGRLRSFGDVPLLVITGEKEIMKARTPQESAEHSVWAQEQKDSTMLSPFSWQVVAAGSGHIVPIDRPDLVITELTRMVYYLRGGPQPVFGRTTTN